MTDPKTLMTLDQQIAWAEKQLAEASKSLAEVRAKEDAPRSENPIFNLVVLMLNASTIAALDDRIRGLASIVDSLYALKARREAPPAHFRPDVDDPVGLRGYGFIQREQAAQKANQAAPEQRRWSNYLSDQPKSEANFGPLTEDDMSKGFAIRGGDPK